MKTIWESKTVWLAVAQAIGGIAIAVFTELEMMGAVLMVKSAVDIMLRMVTEDPII